MWEKSIFPHFLLLNLLVNVYSKDCLYSEKKLTEKYEKTMSNIVYIVSIAFLKNNICCYLPKFHEIINNIYYFS